MIMVPMNSFEKRIIGRKEAISFLKNWCEFVGKPCSSCPFYLPVPYNTNGLSEYVAKAKSNNEHFICCLDEIGESPYFWGFTSKEVREYIVKGDKNEH